MSRDLLTREQHINDLLEQLQHRDFAVRCRAKQQLIGLGDDPATVRALVEALEHAPSSGVRAMAAWCLGRIGLAHGATAARPALGALVEALLCSRYWDVRLLASEALGRIDTEAAREALRQRGARTHRH